MERKIGEIFEYNGEWYQCVEQPEKYDETVCSLCAFRGNGNCELDRCSGTYRSDKKHVIFKKLEKVGKPITVKDRIFQCLNAFKTECTGCVFLNHKRGCDKCNYTDDPCPDSEIWVEIKQNKENMEEKKQKLDDLVGLYTSAKITYKEFDEKLKTLYADKEECKSSLKEFDLEAAKAGKPVCTRDGKPARIICWDKLGNLPIVALVMGEDNKEFVFYYNGNGRDNETVEKYYDLMMAPERHEGWINVYKGGKLDADYIYPTKADAVENIFQPMNDNYIDTIKVNWSE